ncbi:hypothetical protein J2S59_002637 [Nocardioides massiliensis]|uniref:VWFD domain-containing protein n=2 Tax=Nocardioides massiliensis TaxID=1325935 RepID=A0ABT9NR17_9ACTN|nr:hypothetical protein [Nocardioides massiliensis]
MPIAIAVLLVLTACTGTTAPAESAPKEDAAATAAAAGAGGNPHTQDLWLFDGLRTLDRSGQVVEHSAAVLAHLSDLEPTGDAIELIPGATFYPLEQIGAHLKGPDGEPRTDADAVVGLVETEVGATFAVLGSVNANSQVPISIEDRFFFDMEFVGDSIAVGDLVSADYTLVQLLPTGEAAEAELNSLELAAHRAAAGALSYTADDDGDVIVLTHQLGRIVQGSTGPELPPKSDDMIDGLKKDKAKCLIRSARPGAALKCIGQHFKNFGDGALSSWQQIWRNDTPEPWRPPSPEPPPLPPAPPHPPCIHPPCGKSTGDPHLTTLDGHRYAMQAVGEFVLARHENDGVEVQIRTAAVDEHVSWVDRVAVFVGETRIIAGLDDLIIDGKAHTLRKAPHTSDGDGYELTHHNKVSVVETDAGHRIWISRGVRATINVVVAAAEADGGWAGLLGDADGDVANDLSTRDGDRLDLDPGFDEFYDLFVAGWRVSDAESLFDYAPGEDTDTFTDLAMPQAEMTVNDLGADQRAHAEAACGLAGVVMATALAECVLDYALTGEIDTLRSARVSDLVDSVLDGRTDPYGVPLDGDSPGPEAVDAWRVGGERLLGAHATDGSVTHHCPAVEADVLSGAVVYGDGTYSPDSGVCAAAVHAGVITVDGGTIEVIATVPDAAGYAARERNDVRARALRADYPWGFRVRRAD